VLGDGDTDAEAVDESLRLILSDADATGDADTDVVDDAERDGVRVAAPERDTLALPDAERVTETDDVGDGAAELDAETNVDTLGSTDDETLTVGGREREPLDVCDGESDTRALALGERDVRALVDNDALPEMVLETVPHVVARTDAEVQPEGVSERKSLDEGAGERDGLTLELNERVARALDDNDAQPDEDRLGCGDRVMESAGVLVVVSESGTRVTVAVKLAAAERDVDGLFVSVGDVDAERELDTDTLGERVTDGERVRLGEPDGERDTVSLAVKVVEPLGVRDADVQLDAADEREGVPEVEGEDEPPATHRAEAVTRVDELGVVELRAVLVGLGGALKERVPLKGVALTVLDVERVCESVAVTDADADAEGEADAERVADADTGAAVDVLDALELPVSLALADSDRETAGETVLVDESVRLAVPRGDREMLALGVDVAVSRLLLEADALTDGLRDGPTLRDGDTDTVDDLLLVPLRDGDDDVDRVRDDVVLGVLVRAPVAVRDDAAETDAQLLREPDGEPLVRALREPLVDVDGERLTRAEPDGEPEIAGLRDALLDGDTLGVTVPLGEGAGERDGETESACVPDAAADGALDGVPVAAGVSEADRLGAADGEVVAVDDALDVELHEGISARPVVAQPAQGHAMGAPTPAGQ